MYPAPPVTRICTDEPILLEARALPAKPSGVGRAAFGEVRSLEGFATGSRRWGFNRPGSQAGKPCFERLPFRSRIRVAARWSPAFEQISIGRRHRTRRERLRRLRGAVTREAACALQVHRIVVRSASEPSPEFFGFPPPGHFRPGEGRRTVQVTLLGRIEALSHPTPASGHNGNNSVLR